MTKQQQINQQLTAELNSSDELVVKEALQKIRAVGSAELIPEILRKWFRSSGETEADITEMLYTLKDKNTISFLVEALEKKEFSNSRDRIIAIFWNAGLEPKEHLSVFVKIATEGNYMECLECLTLIENMEPPFPEEQLLESMLILKTYFGEDKNRSHEKFELIRTIATIVAHTDDWQVE